MLLCQLMAQSMNIYLFTDYFKSATLLSVVSLASFIPILIMAPIARILSEKFGKKECSIVGVSIAVLGYGALFVAHTTNPIVYIVLMLIASIGMGFFNMVIWAFITDIIDYQEEMCIRDRSRHAGPAHGPQSGNRTHAPWALWSSMPCK